MAVTLCATQSTIVVGVNPSAVIERVRIVPTGLSCDRNKGLEDGAWRILGLNGAIDEGETRGVV